MISTANPASAFVNRDSATGLNASVTAGVASGTYYARVDGVGNGTGTTGYTDYASIGAYTLTVSGCNGQAAPAAPANLAVTTNQTGTSATVTWAAPVSDGGSPVTGYTASRSGAAPESLSRRDVHEDLGRADARRQLPVLGGGDERHRHRRGRLAERDHAQPDCSRPHPRH